MEPLPSITEAQRVVHALLFGEEPTLSGRDIAALTSTDIERDKGFWRALGFPVPRDDEVAYFAEDAEALRRLHSLESAGFVDDELAVVLARSMGRALAGVARGQAEVVEQVIAELALTTEESVARLKQTIPDIEALIVFVWRRHLSAAIADAFATPDPGTLRELAVGFVDVTGYTALAREHPAEVVHHLIRNFEAHVTDEVATVGGRVVSTLGDAVLFTVADPIAAGRLSLRLAALPERTQLPPVRVGLAYGQVTAHHGDVLGPVVNLAARLCEVARPGTVLLDRDAAAHLRDLPDVEVRRIARQPVRGYAHLEPWVLRERSRERDGR
ncbi:MAG TPA: adenylate/guanylate cyclase domain-containing protein [Mycobacteriales bacterium]|nr:adenylate/guanylate cyclase domain-containing protein [Mycobacteriales bacterium]